MRILQLAGEYCAIAILLVVLGVLGALTPLTIYGIIKAPVAATALDGTPHS